MKVNLNEPKINKFMNQEDFNISICNEHNDQDITSMDETIKTSGIIKLTNFPNYITSFSHNNVYMNQTDSKSQKMDSHSFNYSKPNKNNGSLINDNNFNDVNKKYNY